MSREVVVVSGVRTAIGTFGGSLKDVPPTELAALVVRESLSRAGVGGEEVGHVVFGHVVNTEPRDMYLSRVAAINGGCAQGTPAFNVNRLCGSGLQALISAAQAIQLGDCDIAIGGGAENMSRAPYASLNTRFGARMGDTQMIDMMIGALHDPFHKIHMGVTAENVATKWGISRADQDQLAVDSHNRAERATTAGYFKDQIVPVMLKSRKGEVAYATDEHFRPGATLDDLMDETASLLRAVLPPEVSCRGVTTSLARFERLRMADAFRLHAGGFDRRSNQTAKKVDVIVVVLALQDRRDTLKPHSRID